MKSTGMVRPVDNLGRVVLPKELRRTLNIREKDHVEIYVEDDLIIFKRYEPACIFCGETNEIVDFNGKRVCGKCAKDLYESL